MVGPTSIGDIQTGGNENGWWRTLPSGDGRVILEQWGKVLGISQSEGAIVQWFPRAYGSAESLVVNITGSNPAGSTSNDGWYQVGSVYNDYFNAVFQATGSGNYGQGYYWHSIGFLWVS
jgi:hypothetical protein